MPTIDTRRVAVAPGVELELRLHQPDQPSQEVRPDQPHQPSSAPVLAVHGLASNARLWDGVAERLAAAGHPVAAVDQRGHGRSDKPADGYDFATLTDDLVAVLDALAADDPAWRDSPPVVAGQSWGGNVVVELAARHPDRVAALVLVDGGTIELSDRFADWPTAATALAPPPLEGVDYDELAARITRMHPDWPPQGVEATLANLERLADGTARPRLPRVTHMAILRELWGHHPSARWPELAMPVVVVVAGSRDDGRAGAAKRDEVGRAARLLPQGRVVWIDGDHDLHAQHPDQIAEIVATAAAAGTLAQ